MAAGFLGALLADIDMLDTSVMVATTMRALLFTSLSAVRGLGVGMVVRRGSGAISGLLVWWFVLFGRRIAVAEEHAHQYVTALIKVRSRRVIVATIEGEVIHDGPFPLQRTLR